MAGRDYVRALRFAYWRKVRHWLGHDRNEVLAANKALEDLPVKGHLGLGVQKGAAGRTIGGLGRYHDRDLVFLARRRATEIKTVFAFAAIYIIWGTTYLGIRVAVETIPPFFMAGTRFVIAGIISFAFLRARGVPMPTRTHWRSALIVGAFLLVGGNGLVTWSEQQVPSGIAALVVATVPLWMTLFDWLIYNGRRPGKKTTAGLILGLLGLALLLEPGQFSGATRTSFHVLLVLFLAPVLWSFGSLHSRQAGLPENTFMSTAMEMLAGGLLLLIAGLFTGEAAKLDLAQISGRSLVSMFYLTVFGSIVALSAYVWLLNKVDAARVATYTYVNPVIAVFLGWLILGESVTPQMLVAIVIIVGAVVWITTRRTKKATVLPSRTTPVPSEPLTAAD